MATHATGLLSSQIPSPSGTAVPALCSLFDAWKAGFPRTEYTSFAFGKDSAYASPAVDGGKYLLRHVHLAPVADKAALDVWRRAFAAGKSSGKGSKRTSDRALVYASRQLAAGGEDHLLIYILAEPDAHQVARMATAEDRHLMQQLASTAAALIENGAVIC